MNFDTYLNNYESFAYSLNPSHLCDFPVPNYTLYIECIKDTSLVLRIYKTEGEEYDTIALTGSSSYEVPLRKYSSIYAIDGFSGNDDLSQGGKDIKSIILPDNLLTLPDEAFIQCSNLETIKIPNSVTYIGESAFESASSLKELIIPQKITTLPENMCYMCTSLEKVSIPNGVLSIGKLAFSSNELLKNIIIPETVVSLADNCFDFCESVTEISIPSKIKELPSYVFYGMKSLTKLTIPQQITNIGDYAFGLFENLTELVFESTIAPIPQGEHIFDLNSAHAVLRYPEGSDYTAWISMLPTAWTSETYKI